MGYLTNMRLVPQIFIDVLVHVLVRLVRHMPLDFILHVVCA